MIYVFYAAIFGDPRLKESLNFSSPVLNLFLFLQSYFSFSRKKYFTPSNKGIFLDFIFVIFILMINDPIQF